MLPVKFTERMKEMLANEYQEFMDSYDRQEYKGLRLNPLKYTSTEECDKKMEEEMNTLVKDWNLTPVPWTKHGYYYASELRPGLHPYHLAGVYYIQEPSAMAPAQLLEACPGETILDLCAAPGGKSTQIAAAMKGKGLLICNEIHPARAKTLSENIERMGIRNAIVTNETPDMLANKFTEFFDCNMVDAPCSGEGMFRKNEDACNEWSLEAVEDCAIRQDHILDCASGMLKPGGRIVYSTCTFAPQEDEGAISRFINSHPEFHVVHVNAEYGMTAGKPEWAKNPVEQIEGTL